MDGRANDAVGGVADGGLKTIMSECGRQVKMLEEFKGNSERT
jgi:hypothetical protein